MVAILGHSLLLLFLSQCVHRFLPWETSFDSALMLQYAVITVCVSVLCAPRPGGYHLLGWALGCSAAFALGVGISGAGFTLPFIYLSILAGTIAMICQGVATLFEGSTGEAFAARLITLLCLLILGAVPLWLGSWLQGELVLALSPLTHLATAADVDYLRFDWFYRYSEFSVIRVQYPSPVILAAVYFFLAIAALVAVFVQEEPTDEKIID